MFQRNEVLISNDFASLPHSLQLNSRLLSTVLSAFSHLHLNQLLFHFACHSARDVAYITSLDVETAAI